MLGGCGSDEAQAWLTYGGRETLASAGVSPDAPDWGAALAKALGPDLVDWLVGLPAMARVGDIVFVHAGLDADAPLDAQERSTLMWTRSPWLDSPGPYDGGVAVVHGHTPQPGVDLSHPHRVNLDTGAFKSGVLSALLVAGDRMRVVQAVR